MRLGTKAPPEIGRVFSGNDRWFATACAVRGTETTTVFFVVPPTQPAALPITSTETPPITAVRSVSAARTAGRTRIGAL